MDRFSNPAVQDFLDRFSAMMEGEGLPHAAGRMLGMFFIEGEPQTATQLAEKLRISRSNVSTTVRLLETFGLVERRKRPGERQALYHLPDDPFPAMLQAGSARAARMHDMVDAFRRTLPAEARPANSRLAELQHFFGYAAGWLEQMRAEWNRCPPS